jgi:hypothetical protein
MRSALQPLPRSLGHGSRERIGHQNPSRPRKGHKCNARGCNVASIGQRALALAECLGMPRTTAAAPFVQHIVCLPGILDHSVGSKADEDLDWLRETLGVHRGWEPLT